MVDEMAAKSRWVSDGAYAKRCGVFTIAKCHVRGEWIYPLFGVGPAILFIGKSFAESAAKMEELK